MKIRQGFVSNSSSSSFVALGFRIKDGKEPYRELAVALGKEEEFNASIKKNTEDYNYDIEDAEREAFCYDIGIQEEFGVMILAGSEDGVGDKTVIAYMVAETDSYSGGDFDGDGEIALDDGNVGYSTLQTLQEAVGGDEEIKIYYGTRCC